MDSTAASSSSSSVPIIGADDNAAEGASTAAAPAASTAASSSSSSVPVIGADDNDDDDDICRYDDIIRRIGLITALSDADSSRMWRLRMEVERIKEVIDWWEALDAPHQNAARATLKEVVVTRDEFKYREEAIVNLSQNDIKKKAAELRKWLHPDKRTGLPINDNFEQDCKQAFQFVHNAITGEVPCRTRRTPATSPASPPPGPPPGSPPPPRGPRNHPRCEYPDDVPPDMVQKCYQKVTRDGFTWIKCNLCSTRENTRYVDGTHISSNKHLKRVSEMEYWLPRDVA